jgi:hypothetical protein
MMWLNPTDQAVRSAVVSGAWGKAPHSPNGHPAPVAPEIDTIADALETASDALDNLTVGLHPAMEVVEDYVAEPNARRLSTAFQPIRAVRAVSVIGTDGASTALQSTSWYVHGGVIRFARDNCIDGVPSYYFEGDLGLSLGGWFALWAPMTFPQRTEQLRVTYDVGSTITASARKAVLALAHEYWLATSRCDSCDECQLPDRTTSVNREGLSYNLQDPVDPLSVGGTGLPGVDLWVRAVNPHGAKRRSGVWTPDAPPPVVRRVIAARAAFPAPVAL